MPENDLFQTEITYVMKKPCFKHPSFALHDISGYITLEQMMSCYHNISQCLEDGFKPTASKNRNMLPALGVISAFCPLLFVAVPLSGCISNESNTFNKSMNQRSSVIHILQKTITSF